MRVEVRPALTRDGRCERSAGRRRSSASREKRRCPPGVVKTRRRPASLQRRTVAGDTPSRRLASERPTQSGPSLAGRLKIYPNLSEGERLAHSNTFRTPGARRPAAAALVISSGPLISWRAFDAVTRGRGIGPMSTTLRGRRRDTDGSSRSAGMARTVHDSHSTMDIQTTNPVRVARLSAARLPTRLGAFEALVFADQLDGTEPVALVCGDVASRDAPLVRVHSECWTGDVVGSLRSDCGEQLGRALTAITSLGAGVLRASHAAVMVGSGTVIADD